MSTESDLKIPHSDGKFTYGRLRGGWDRPLVIFLHGFSANIDRIIPYSLSKFLDAHGFSVLRANSYGASDDARKLIDTTLKIQNSDLADIINYARRQGAKRVHVAGHSYGGLTILTTPHLDADSALLIDPSHPDIQFLERAPLIPELGLLRMQSKGLEYLVGQAAAKEYTQLKTADFLPNFRTPSLIISGAGGPLANTNREYARALNSHTDIKLVEIPGAGHLFNTDDHLDQLLDSALNWLQSRKDPK